MVPATEVKEVFLARIQGLLNLVNNYENWNFNGVDIIQTRADLLYRHSVRLGSLGIVQGSVIEKLRELVDLLVKGDDSSVCFQSDLEFSGSKGRPKFRITAEQLSHLVEHNFNAVQMATMFGVSDRTVRSTPCRVWYRVNGNF